MQNFGLRYVCQMVHLNAPVASSKSLHHFHRHLKPFMMFLVMIWNEQNKSDNLKITSNPKWLKIIKNERLNLHRFKDHSFFYFQLISTRNLHFFHPNGVSHITMLLNFCCCVYILWYWCLFFIGPEIAGGINNDHGCCKAIWGHYWQRQISGPKLYLILALFNPNNFVCLIHLTEKSTSSRVEKTISSWWPYDLSFGN